MKLVPAIALWLSVVLPLSPVRADVDETRAREIVGKRCYSCHGLAGLSTTSQFPKLAGQNVEYLTKQMFNFQTRARRSVVMEEQMAGLTGNEVEALALYFSRQASSAEAVENPRALALGRKIYFDGNPQKGVSACASCHGPNARGAQMLPRLAGQHATYIERQLRAFIARSRTNDRYKMHMVARGLVNEEIQSVAYFISGMD